MIMLAVCMVDVLEETSLNPNVGFVELLFMGWGDAEPDVPNDMRSKPVEYD